MTIINNTFKNEGEEIRKTIKSIQEEYCIDQYCKYVNTSTLELDKSVESTFIDLLKNSEKSFIQSILLEVLKKQDSNILLEDYVRVLIGDMTKYLPIKNNNFFFFTDAFIKYHIGYQAFYSYLIEHLNKTLDEAIEYHKSDWTKKQIKEYEDQIKNAEKVRRLDENNLRYLEEKLKKLKGEK